MTCFFALTGSAFIDPETCPWVWLKFFYELYPKRAYRFAFPIGFLKVTERVPVGCSDLFTSIYCFACSKISFKFFVQAIFRWFLTCVYYIYLIRVHWSWNLSLGVIVKFSVGHIQTGNTDSLPLQVCGKSWQECRFLFHLSPSITWLASSQFLKFFKFSVVELSVSQRGTDTHLVY